MGMKVIGRLGRYRDGLLLALSLLTWISAALSDDAEKAVLLEWRDGLSKGSQFTDNWDEGTDMCKDWPAGSLRIACINGSVLWLDLSGLELQGTLPEALSAFKHFSGMSQSRINLSGNRFHGTLPASWSSMRAAGLIDLRDNELDGELPSEWGKSLFQDFGAGTLSLTGNELSGQLPREYSAMEKLQQLHLGGNELSGPLPLEWSALSSLAELELSGNRLTRTLPAQWSTMEALSSLSLGSNSLEGVLPPSWSSLDLLQSIKGGTVDVAGNSGLCGFIPWTLPWSELPLEALEATSLHEPCPIGSLDQEQQHADKTTAPEAAEEGSALGAKEVAVQEEAEPKLTEAEDGNATAAEVPEVLEGSTEAGGLQTAVLGEAAEEQADFPAVEDADADDEEEEQEEEEDAEEEEEEAAIAAAMVTFPAEDSLASLLEPDQDKPIALRFGYGSEPPHFSSRETQAQEPEPSVIQELPPFEEGGSTPAPANLSGGGMASTGGLVSANASTLPAVTESVEATESIGDVASAPDSASPAKPAAIDPAHDPEAIGELPSKPASGPPSMGAIRDMISKLTTTLSSIPTSTNDFGEDLDATRDINSTTPSFPAAPGPLEVDMEATNPTEEDLEDTRDVIPTPTTTLSSIPASTETVEEDTEAIRDIVSTPTSTEPSIPASTESIQEDTRDVISTPASTLPSVPASGDSSEGPSEDVKDAISTPASTQFPTPASGDSSEGPSEDVKDAISTPVSTSFPTPASGDSSEGPEDVISTPSTLPSVPASGDASKDPEDVKDAVSTPASTQIPTLASGDSSEGPDDITDVINAPVSTVPASTKSVGEEPEDNTDTIVTPVSTLPSVPAATGSVGEDQEDSSDAISTPALSSAPTPKAPDSFEEDPADTISTRPPASAATDSSDEEHEDAIDLTASPDSAAPEVLPSKSSSNSTDESNSAEIQTAEPTDSPAAGSSTISPGDDDSSLPESTEAEGALQPTMVPVPDSTDRADLDGVATSVPTDGAVEEPDATPQAPDGAIAPEPEPEEEAIPEPTADDSSKASPEPTATSREDGEEGSLALSTPEATATEATAGSGPDETGDSGAKPAVMPEEWGIEVFKRPGSIQSGSNVTLRIAARIDTSQRRSLMQTSTGKRLSATYFGDGLFLDCSLIIKGPSGAMERCKDCCRSSDPLTGYILAVMQPTASGVHVVRALLCQTGSEKTDALGTCFTSESSNFTVAAAPTDPSNSVVELVSGGEPGQVDVAVGDESVVRVSPRDRFGNAQDYKLWRSAAGHDDVRVSVWRVPSGDEDAAVEAKTVAPAVEAVLNSTTGETDLILRFKQPLEGKVAMSVLLKDSKGEFVPVGRGEGGRLLALAIGPERRGSVGGPSGSGSMEPSEGSKDGNTAADEESGGGIFSLPLWVYIAIAAGGVALISVIACSAVFLAAKRRAKRKALEEYFFDPEKAEPDPPAYRLGPDGLPAGASAEGSVTNGGGGGSESPSIDMPPGKEDTPTPLRSKFGTNSKASPDAGYVDVRVTETDISSVEISLSTSSVSLETSDPEVKRRIAEAAMQPPRRSSGGGRGNDRAEPTPVAAASHADLQQEDSATTPSAEGFSAGTTTLVRMDSAGSNGSRRPRQPLVDDDIDSSDFSDDDDGSEEIESNDETSADEATPTSLRSVSNPFMSPSSIASTPFAMTPASGGSFGNPLYRQDSHGNGIMPQGGVSPGVNMNPLYTPEKPEPEGEEPSMSNPFANASFDVVDSAPFAQPNPFAEISADVGNPFEDPGNDTGDEDPSSVGGNNPFDVCSPDVGTGSNPFADGDDPESGSSTRETLPEAKTKGGITGRGWGLGGFLRRGNHGSDSQEAPPAVQQQQQGKKLGVFSRWGGRGQRGGPEEKPEPAEEAPCDRIESEGHDDSARSEDLS